MVHNWYGAHLIGALTIRDRVREAALGGLWKRVRPPARTGPSGHLELHEGARVTLVLEAGELLSFRSRRRPHRLLCLDGKVWATEERCRVDHLLSPGEERGYSSSGKVVIQALRSSTVRIDCRSPARLARRSSAASMRG